MPITDNRSAWDYSPHAEYYKYRPNYAEPAIERLLVLVGAGERPGFIAVDVGAGTGNLTVLLLQHGLRHIVAIEPNADMRWLGQQATRGHGVLWVDATGERTALAESSVDWFAMGSSFNTTRREETLVEAHRALAPGGHFTCLWNNRDLDGDPVQSAVERIIRRHVPEYRHGTRRQDQTAIIIESGLFGAPIFFEETLAVTRTLDEYLLAWKSVCNSFWDLTTPEGNALFDGICADIRREIGNRTLEMRYRTRCWTARVKD